MCWSSAFTLGALSLALKFPGLCMGSFQSFFRLPSSKAIEEGEDGGWKKWHPTSVTSLPVQVVSFTVIYPHGHWLREQPIISSIIAKLLSVFCLLGLFNLIIFWPSLFYLFNSIYRRWWLYWLDKWTSGPWLVFRLHLSQANFYVHGISSYRQELHHAFHFN